MSQANSVKLYFILGLIYIGISLPLYFKRIKPNGLYGFRTSKTLSDPDIWYRANHVAGFDLAVAGAAIALVSVLSIPLTRIFPKLTIDVINLFFLLAATAAALIHSFWELSKM